MANYNDVLGALREYRNELEQEVHLETEAHFTDGGMKSFSARGGVSAFTTPLSNVHATGAGIRLKGGKIMKDDYVLKVYVFDKLDLGTSVPALTKNFQGIEVDIEPLPIQLALAVKAARKKASAKKAASPRKPHPSKNTEAGTGLSLEA